MRQRLFLEPHPDTPCPFVSSLEVGVSRRGSSLSLDYELRGDTAALRIPGPVTPARRDGLWRHSCFEAFIRCGRDAAYLEVNLSPSTEWAAYSFDRYRDGMAQLATMPDPDIYVLEDEGICELMAAVDLAGASGFDRGEMWRIGLAAVIEDAQGAKSYWALAHPPGAPDFHHEDCFALELPPAA